MVKYHVSLSCLLIFNLISIYNTNHPVQSYIFQLFAPLAFLGSIYNSIIYAFIDMKNLSELLAEYPDVRDHKNAGTLQMVHQQAPEVKFQDVVFHYPSQVRKYRWMIGWLSIV